MEIIINKGFLKISKTDFNCPKCDKLHEEKDYYKRLYKSKGGLISIRCKLCNQKIFITSDYQGDISIWIDSNVKDS